MQKYPNIWHYYGSLMGSFKIGDYVLDTRYNLIEIIYKIDLNTYHTRDVEVWGSAFVYKYTEEEFKTYYIKLPEHLALLWLNFDLE